MTLVLVANLDAELEFADPAHAPSSRLLAAMAERAAPLAAALGADVLVHVPGTAPRAGVRGAAAALCWSPTPRALAACAELGVRPPPAPAFATLQRVNHRAFAATLAPSLPGARFVRSREELSAHLATMPADRALLLKRPFAFAGRARKRIDRPQALFGADRTWAEASMDAYGCGLQVEPWNDVLADFALHGVLTPRGELHLGSATVQTIDAEGAWCGSRLAAAGELDAAEVRSLRAAATAAADALAAAGYFGPFGIDGYRWRAADGAVQFHPRSDLNARLTMGFAVGMGASARDLLAGLA